jgi:hypothetical protein
MAVVVHNHNLWPHISEWSGKPEPASSKEAPPHLCLWESTVQVPACPHGADKVIAALEQSGHTPILDEGQHRPAAKAHRPKSLLQPARPNLNHGGRDVSNAGHLVKQLAIVLKEACEGTCEGTRGHLLPTHDEGIASKRPFVAYLG